VEERELVQRLTETESRSKSNCHRLDRLESKVEEQDEMISCMKVFSVKLENTAETVGEIKADVKKLTSANGKKWEKLIDLLLAAVVGAFLAWAFSALK